MEVIKCYTDSSYNPITRKAVIGSKIGDQPIELLVHNDTNNTRAEIIGVITLIQKLSVDADKKYIVFTDSLSKEDAGERFSEPTDCLTVLNVIAKKERLIKSNFMSNKNVQLRNADIYKILFALLRPDVTIQHIKGHIKNSLMTPDNVIFSKLDRTVRNELRRM